MIDAKQRGRLVAAIEAHDTVTARWYAADAFVAAGWHNSGDRICRWIETLSDDEALCRLRMLIDEYNQQRLLRRGLAVAVMITAVVVAMVLS